MLIYLRLARLIEDGDWRTSHSLLQRLQACSATAARLSTDSDNQVMHQVANTAGFQITAMTLRFQRTVHRDERDW